MSLAVFAVVLFAAALHASWNAVVKGSTDKLLTTALVVGCAALIAFESRSVRVWGAGEWLLVSTAVLGVVMIVAHAWRVGRAYPAVPGSDLVMAVPASLAALLISLGLLLEHPECPLVALAATGA